MKNRKQYISSFSPQKSDTITFDTNILIKLLYPVNYKNTYLAYENLFNEILHKKSNLIISSIQISEFINRCIRLQYTLYIEENNLSNYDFKSHYRETTDYRDSMNAILEIVKSDILSNFTFVDDCFSKMQQNNIFIYGFSYDFNDAFLVEFSKIYNAILVTDDTDFGNYNTNINIVTANKKLLLFT